MQEGNHMQDQQTGCMCSRTKHRTDEEKKALSNRISRIEGQLRGIRGMLERDAYCPDILTQISAASAALNGLGRVLLTEHIRTCVAEDVRQGREDSLTELLDTLQKFMK